jgi:hypothetical protein
MQIDPKYVNSPKVGKRYGSVVDVGGQRFMVASNLIAQFEVGKRYDCEVVEKTWGEDKVKVIERVIFDAPPNGAGGISTGAIPPASPASRMPNGNGNGNHSRDEQLFVLAILKSGLESGRIADLSPDALVKIIEDLRAVYARTFGRA